MVTLLDVSAVEGHHAMPAALLLNGSISNLCKLIIQDGRQGPLPSFSCLCYSWYLENHWLKLIQLCARMFLVRSRFDIL